jgi:hypothetical protein
MTYHIVVIDSFERMVKLYNYNAAVDLAMHSFIPELRAKAWNRAVELGKELGLVKEELQDG